MYKFLTADNMRLIMQHTPAAIAMFDLNMCYIVASERWIKDYKLEKKYIIGLSHYDVFPQIRNMPHWLDLHQKALNGEVIICDEEEWKICSGISEWIKYEIHPWRDTKGNIAGIIMFTELITEKKRIEKNLREREETYRAVMEHSPIGMALVGLGGEWLKVNKSLINLLGYEEREFLKLNFQVLTHPDDLENDLQHVQSLLDGHAKTYQIEKRYITKQGKAVWAVLNVTLLCDEYEKPKYFLAQITDISAQKAIDEIQDEFISLVGHELKTPLTSVSLALNMLEPYKDLVNDEKFNQYLRLTQRNCGRLKDMITDIVDLNRIKAGLFTYENKDIDVLTLSKQVIADNSILSQIYNVSIEMAATPSGRIAINADPERVAQVLTNLISNAARFSKSGGVVTIDIQHLDGIVTISVKDRGTGIPKEFHDSIFQKFSQADHGEGRKKDGTGLGLYISKELTEAMGGKIGFTSTPQKETVFWISFPAINFSEPAR